MLLAIDVGNTETKVGAFEGDRLVARWRLASNPGASTDELALLISGLLGMRGTGLDGVDEAVVASVVPELGSRYRALFHDYAGKSCLEVGPDVETGLSIGVDDPDAVGADRLANAVAAYDRVRSACITVDLGTATTLDAVSGAGEYLGGAIAPGLEVSIEGLSEHTANLPRIDPGEPPAAIGRDTRAAMRSGFIYGFAGLVDGIARRIVAELGERTRVIATGGLVDAVAPSCETIDEVDELLTLTGLRLIWERNR
jgi:type III pantothenate kinase